MIAKFVREPECHNITGLSRTTRWRLEKEGKFPKRRHISQNTIGWLSSDLDEWMKNRIDAASSVSRKIRSNAGSRDCACVSASDQDNSNRKERAS